MKQSPWSVRFASKSTLPKASVAAMASNVASLTVMRTIGG
jgi:hypothetical protein